MDKHIETMLGGMTAQELATACTYVRSGMQSWLECLKRLTDLRKYKSKCRIGRNVYSASVESVR